MSFFPLPVQVQSFSLNGAGAVAGATTLVLKSFLQIDGVTPITIGDFGTEGYGTIEPGNNTLEEQISFTGITQNANGTATLTGVKTVLFVTPFTETSGLAKTHAGSTTFVISNDAGFYNAIKGYIDSSVSAGAVPATTTVNGIGHVSVNPVDPANPIFVGDNDTRVPTQSENDALVGTNGTPSSTNPYVTETGLIAVNWGGGGDGTVAFDGTNTFAFASKSSNTYTLTRDVYADVVTVSAPVTVKTGGYIIYAITSLTNAGTIQNNGTAGGNGLVSSGNNVNGGTAGAGGAGGTLQAGPAGQNGGVAGIGGAGPGINGTSRNPSIGSNGSAGGAGAGGGGAASSGGTATGEVVNFTNSVAVTTALTAGVETSVTTSTIYEAAGATSGAALSSSAGSGSGGGGGGDPAGSGGGSGGSGGIVVLAASAMVNTGSITANGGDGGNGGSSTNGGGGGGGAPGGVIVLIYHTLTAGTISATGGNAGSKGTGGAGGTNGTAGLSGKIYKVKTATSF